MHCSCYVENLFHDAFFIICIISFLQNFFWMFYISFKLHTVNFCNSSMWSHLHCIVKELCVLIFMHWLIAACGGTVQVNSTARTLRPVVTTDMFISCGWMILGSRDQQIQLSITSVNLTPCTNLSYSNTSVSSCSCSYLEVRCNLISCKIFVCWILSQFL